MTPIFKPFLLGGALAAACLATPLTAAAAPTTPLSQNAHVMGQLVAARMADVIRHQCPTISGRVIKAFFKAEELKNYALDQGYTADQIRAFLKDPKAKAMVSARADAGLKKLGARPGDAQSYCKAGKAEIASGSLTGSLLSD